MKWKYNNTRLIQIYEPEFSFADLSVNFREFSTD